jgi:catechol 2,3-dioxygenase-like lactoylglutathione lyase family enzyme
MIQGVNQVVLEVEDQDRALDFWSKRLGFELAQDARMATSAGSR